MKQALLSLIATSGGFAPFRFANRRKALILTYHRFSEGPDPLRTSARAFAEQIAYLSRRYTLVPLSLIAEHLVNGRSLPAGIAAITVDDGYRDAYEVAFPVLQRFGVPATIFVVTDFVDGIGWIWTDKLRFLLLQTPAQAVQITIAGRRVRGELNGRTSRLALAACINSRLKTLPDEEKEQAIEEIASSMRVSLPDRPPSEFGSVTWEQVREMHAAGLEFGSHTCSHPILTNVTDERLRAELQSSRRRLEAVLGERVRLFCYPNGSYDGRVRAELAQAGYRCAVTTEPGFNDERSDPLALRRIHTERDLSHFVQRTSGFEQVKERIRGAAAQAGGRPSCEDDAFLA